MLVTEPEAVLLKELPNLLDPLSLKSPGRAWKCQPKTVFGGPVAGARLCIYVALLPAHFDLVKS